MCACAKIVFSEPHLIFETSTVRHLLFVHRRQEANGMKRASKQKSSFSLNNNESKSKKSSQQQIARESDFCLCHFDLPVNYRIYYIHHVFLVYMANIQPLPLDISPQLRLGPISLGSGCIFAIYTLKPWYIYYIYIYV